MVFYVNLSLPEIRVMDIQRIKNLADSIKKEYESPSNDTTRWFQDFSKEVKALKEYRGREVYELLQNADDAQSDTVVISIDTDQNVLTVENSGADTRLFNYEGIKSILLSDMSPKAGTAMIGEMGLGFRSVLNWTDKIEIKSDNLSARFGADIAKEYWEKLKCKVEDVEKCEKEARRHGREVPLAILAVPQIESIEPSKTTSIILTYDESKVEESILRSLKTFQPEFLLFLKHVTKIVIRISGLQEDRVLTKQKLQEKDGIVTYNVNGSIWAVTSERTEMNQSVCETACAFCLNAAQDSYCIHTFFPTKVDFPFPCILHATLALDSSRNALLPDNQVNIEVISRLACRIQVMADYLKTQGHDWYPYLLMRPDAALNHKNEYIQQLVNEVRSLSEGGEYVPAFDGSWVSESTCYYYSDDVFSFIQDDLEAKGIFAKMRLSGAPKYASLDTFDPDSVARVNAYFEHLAGSSNLDSFAHAVKLFYECKTCHDHRYNIMPDDGFNIIKVSQDNQAYINTGQVVDGIPEFRKINYVNKDLVQKLLTVFGIPVDDKEHLRTLAKELQKVTYVIATDISAITGKLLPKRSDENLSEHQKEELLKCLFKLFLQGRRTNDSGYSPCLMSEAGTWSETNTLVFLDERFPDGFKNLQGITSIYGPEDGVAYPEFLMDIEGVTPGDVEAFYESLGVSRYLRYKNQFFGDDTDYVNKLMEDSKLPSEFPNNCMKYRVGDGYNMAWVVEKECFDNLPLNEALRLISLSGYRNEVVKQQKVTWFKNRYFDDYVSLSYAAYWLRQIPCFKELQYYVIDEDAWLPGKENNPLTVGSDYSEKELLKALGAKTNLSEFSREELYAAFNDVADLYEKGSLSESRIVEHYISLIKALENKNESYSSDICPVRLVCKVGDRCEVRDSRVVYYSNNNEFPIEVRRTLPMLLMRSRQGEKNISNILGCRTLKEIDVHVDCKTDNDVLTRELARYLEARKAYFLAFASLGVGKRGGQSRVMFNEEYKGAISAFNVTVLCDVKCRYGDDPAQVQMKDEGELLVTHEAFHVCSDATTLKDAMSNPRFNSSVIEALCLKLKLQGFELSDKFYRILTSGERALEYYRKQEVDDALWLQCQSQFDYTAEDIEFWRRVFDLNGLDLSLDNLKTDKASYLADTLKVSQERVRSVMSFMQYHMQELQKCREEYKHEYLHYIYESLLPHPDRHQEYHIRQREYNDNGWLEALLDVEDNKYRVDLTYEELISSALRERFSCQLPVQNPVVHNRLECYKDVDAFNLSDEEKGLLYFEGHDEYFEKLRHDDADIKPADDAALEAKSEICQILESGIKKPKTYLSVSRDDPDKHVTPRSRRKISDRRKIQLGKEAEDAVFNALKANDEYEILHVYSSYLAKDDLGDDSKGYDLEYRRKGDTLNRCLEIKHFDGSSIILSVNEYDVATSREFKDRYDLALYHDKTITIVRNPFSDPGKFDLRANDYTVRFALEKIVE